VLLVGGAGLEGDGGGPHGGHEGLRPVGLPEAAAEEAADARPQEGVGHEAAVDEGQGRVHAALGNQGTKALVVRW
jgi:hypothetical protein